MPAVLAGRITACAAIKRISLGFRKNRKGSARGSTSRNGRSIVCRRSGQRPARIARESARNKTFFSDRRRCSRRCRWDSNIIIVLRRDGRDTADTAHTANSIERLLRRSAGRGREIKFRRRAKRIIRILYRPGPGHQSAFRSESNYDVRSPLIELFVFFFLFLYLAANNRLFSKTPALTSAHSKSWRGVVLKNIFNYV